MSAETYRLIGAWVTIPVFIASWIYCIAHYGFLLGLGIGWLPSIMLGSLVGAAWPALALGAIWLILHAA